MSVTLPEKTDAIAGTGKIWLGPPDIAAARRGRVGAIMRKVFSVCLFSSCLVFSSLSGQAGQAPEGQAGSPAAPASAPAPAKAAAPSTSRSDAAEARYRAWVEKEHAQDAAVFSKEKGKIEDKYKGYVRPKREKKDAKAEPAPAKAN
jgi:hypothetical protein